MNSKSIFSQNLKYFMKLHGKTKKNISEELNIPYSTVTSWYKGEYFPRIDKVEALANYFEIEVSDLITRPKLDIIKEENKKPNGFSWFALGFSIATLIAVLLK